MNRYFQFAISLIVVFLANINASSQNTMDVSKFSRLDNDLMARITNPVRDLDEGKLCALVRVYTPIENLEVRPDALGIVEQQHHNGEIWLYVPYGARTVSFSAEGFFPVVYQYPEPLIEGTVYELRITQLDGFNQGKSQSNTQSFVLIHNPDNSSVWIDDMEMPTENGVFSAMMSKGVHKYRVTAPMYEEVENEFELDESPVREVIKLLPLYGTIEVNTLPENDFNVWANGELLGVSPFKSKKLEPGAYHIKVEKKDYYPVDTLVRLRAGDRFKMTTKLTSFADSLFYNRELGGHKVSFGIYVGYAHPMVMSKAKGGFTGSVINYSLGNHYENLKYTSQSGFFGGMIFDFKLYKNFYLQTGIDFLYIKYTNIFDKTLENFVYRTLNRQAWVGDMKNAYHETYTQMIFELPVLASYRFVLSRRSSLHINLGPYLSYNLSSKMKINGSSDIDGVIYNSMMGEIDYNTPIGTFQSNDHIKGKFDMNSTKFTYTTTYESGMSIGATRDSSYDFEESPFNKINAGVRIGLVYELKGFQFGIHYDFQFTNMANKKFWETERVPIFNNMIGENNMSGYNHKIHTLAVTVGYIFRY